MNVKYSDFYFSIFKIGYNVFGKNSNFLINNNLCHSKILKHSNNNIAEFFNFCFPDPEFDFYKPSLSNRYYFYHILFSYFLNNTYIFAKIIKISSHFIYIYLGLFFIGICYLDKSVLDNYSFRCGEFYCFRILKINYENNEIFFSL